MNAVKVIINSYITKNSKYKLCEFYTSEEPSKEYIKDYVENALNTKLEVRDCSPDDGGDFGLFFYYGSQYITYTFEKITIQKIN
jgi:hypothetical protein